MDHNTRELCDDIFLRTETTTSNGRAPVSNTSTPVSSTLPTTTNAAFKTEMPIIYLSDDSQKLTMDTLVSIYGKDFQLKETPAYKGRSNNRLRDTYWEDRGTLRVQGITNFSVDNRNECLPDDPLERFAILKLESYGFHARHCAEAYKYCENKTDAALELLFEKYMRFPTTKLEEVNANEISEQELLSMRADEREALESIYDKDFEEKEPNILWSLKIPINHLINKNKPTKDTKAVMGKKEKPSCRNWERNGTCKFGNQCRFQHKVEEKATKKNNEQEEKIEKCISLEIRFPKNTKYPYEPPYIYLKSTSGDIPHLLQLRLTRRLYKEACEICADGMPCIYSISELLQSENILDMLEDDYDTFPDPEQSIFYVPAQQTNGLNKLNSKTLPTHYELGQTSHSGSGQHNKENLIMENRKLARKFAEIQHNEEYQKRVAARRKLPAFDKRNEILDLIKKSQVLVISGETGCGKSTQVPQFILDDWLTECQQSEKQAVLPHVEIICTQPRRLSAMGVAARVADERAERLGQTVGYHIRLESKISASTRLTFCTTGILLRRLTADPTLSSVSHIIIDEVHERSEESDFLLNILKGLLPQRPDLKVLLMSATLNAQVFCNYFGKIPMLDIPGRTFPVEQLFLENVLEVCDYVLESNSEFSRKMTKKEAEGLLDELQYADTKANNVAPPNSLKDEKLNLPAIYARYAGFEKRVCNTLYLMEPMKTNPELIEAVLKYIVDGNHEWPKDGTILVFLPGLQEIQTVYDALCDSSQFSPRAGKFILVPLHSALNSEEQVAVFKHAPKGKRKIVLSTNIAETSVTIDDCVFVVDSGLMKEKHFNATSNMESLELVWESRANAKQRQGRAGRVMPGVCIHLFTKHRFQYHMLQQPIPEIHRVPLEQLCLRIKTLPFFEKFSVLDVMEKMLEPPSKENVSTAVVRLRDIGALDAEEQLTSLGHHLAALPVDVRIGKLMLFGAIFQCLDSVLTIAACLSNRSPFVSSFNKRTEATQRKKSFATFNSDHLTAMAAYQKWLDVSRRNVSAGRNYAVENYLSFKTMETISEIKYQFLELLVSIGFVPINVPRRRKSDLDNVLELTGHDLNLNGGNHRLLISLLYASLYPNIVKVLTTERSYVQTFSGALPKALTAKDLKFKTRDSGYVAIHPSSINADSDGFAFPFLVYQEKIKTSRIFIRECSVLTAVPLVLFAGSDLQIVQNKEDFFFVLEEGWILLKAHSHEVAQMIQYLRVELFKLLEEKIRDPCLNLLHHANGRKIIHNIVYLITKNM